MTKNLKTILIIEDDNFILDYIEFILNERNYNIIKCDKGIKGYEKSLEGGIDLILLDLSLPDISGIDLLKNFKTDTRTFSIPVIVVSSISDNNTINACYNLGIEEFIFKPFEVSDLIDSIERATNIFEKISVKKLAGKICIELKENITKLEGNKIKGLIQHFINQNTYNIIIDLTEVTFIEEDINMIFLSTLSKLNYNGGKLLFISPKKNTKVHSKIIRHFNKYNIIFETFPLAIRS